MKIALLGDIGLLGCYTIANNPSLKTGLKEVSDYLAKFDLVVGNLETPFSRAKKPHGAKSAYICTDPENVEILKWLHVDAVTLANNHVYDFGNEAFELTKRILEQNGIAYFGVDGKDFRTEKCGERIAFSGFCCYSSNPLHLCRQYGDRGVNRFNIKEVERLLLANSQDGWFNILSVHSGIEHVNYPSTDQIRAARRFSEITPYVFYGHHPHVVQGIELQNGALVAHSLGNFCFAGHNGDKLRPQAELSENNRQGMILELDVNKGHIEGYAYQLMHIHNNGKIELIADKGCVDKYSAAITSALDDEVAYNSCRVTQRNEYLSERRQLRNFKWFMTHLRYRYFRLAYDNHRNAALYRRNVVDLL